MNNGARAARRTGAGTLGVMLALGVVLAGAPGAAAAEPSPEMAAAASLFLPGLGQALQGNYGEGGLQGALFLGALWQEVRFESDPDFIPVEDREDPVTGNILTNAATHQADFFYFAVQNLAFYSAFAAYRDGRAAAADGGDATPGPRESFAELALAPFQGEYLFRPVTLAALLLPLYIALSPRDDGRVLYQPTDGITPEQIAAADMGIHFGVAIGEEAFFRGVLNTGLSERLGRWWGLAASSLLFGLSHQGSAGQATAASATGFGAFLGYLQQENGYDIRQGIAIHFWWNFLVSLGLLDNQEKTATVPLLYVAFRF